ncbi:MAG: CapA family protein, partial [Coriobacteriia bacterium]|nr:CapA family protein [Coriobacteriia bacterium]
GASVAFLSFSHILPSGFIATDSKAGLAAGRNNMDAVTKAIAAAKADNDYVIVSYHWGIEYKDNANADQVRDARASIDAGADMVLSHHPHVIQGIEFYEGGLIAYSTGDFLFDHYSRKTGEAFILKANLGPDGVTDVAATPVYLDSSGAPAVVTGNEATVILDRLKTISTPHGTSVTIASDIARLTP